MSIGYQHNLSGMTSWDQMDRQERGRHLTECRLEREILEGTVQELLEWWGEDDPRGKELLEIVASAAEEKATLELRFEAHC